MSKSGTFKLSGSLVRPSITFANKTSEFWIEQVPRLRDVCQCLRELILMHRQNGTIECAVRGVGLHGGDVIVHRVPIIQRPCGSGGHRGDFATFFGCRARPVLLNLPCELIPLAKRM